MTKADQIKILDRKIKPNEVQYDLDRKAAKSNKVKSKLRARKNKTENIKEVTDFAEEPLSLEAKRLIEEIKFIQKDADQRKLKITGGNKTTYDFSDYKTFKELFRDLYYKNMEIDEAEGKQDEFDGVLDALRAYSAKKKEYLEAKNRLLNNAKKIYQAREKTTEGFKSGIFPLNYDEEEEQELRDKEEENDIRDENGLIDYKRLEGLK